MRKIIVGAQVSMDGVMQAPGGPWEDPTTGFKFGGWVMPYFDQEFGKELDRVFKEKFDLLLGRKTYEIFAAMDCPEAAHEVRCSHRSCPPTRVVLSLVFASTHVSCARRR